MPCIQAAILGIRQRFCGSKIKACAPALLENPKIFDLFCHAHAFVLSDDTLRFMPEGTGAPEIQPVFYKHSRIFAVQPV